MSTIVVTPPAAAAVVARATPSAGSLRVWTWASTTPGRTSPAPASSLRCPASEPGAPMAAMRPSRIPSSPGAGAALGRARRPATTRSNEVILSARDKLNRRLLPAGPVRATRLLLHSENVAAIKSRTHWGAAAVTSDVEYLARLGPGSVPGRQPGDAVGEPPPSLLHVRDQLCPAGRRHAGGRHTHRQRGQHRPCGVGDRHGDRVESDRRLLAVLRESEPAHLAEDAEQLVDVAQPPTRGCDQRSTGELTRDHALGPVGKYYASAGRGEGRRTAAHVRDQAHGVRGLLDRDERRLVTVQNGQADGLVVVGEQLGRDATEGAYDRVLGRLRGEAEGADAQLVAAVGVAEKPASLHQDATDTEEGALRESQRGGELAEAQWGVRDHCLQHRECGVGAGRTVTTVPFHWRNPVRNIHIMLALALSVKPTVGEG